MKIDFLKGVKTPKAAFPKYTSFKLFPKNPTTTMENVAVLSKGPLLIL